MMALWAIRWECRCGEAGIRERDHRDEQTHDLFFACTSCGVVIFSATLNPEGAPFVRIAQFGATVQVLELGLDQSPFS
jgi:hypothetical protein